MADPTDLWPREEAVGRHVKLTPGLAVSGLLELACLRSVTNLCHGFLPVGPIVDMLRAIIVNFRPMSTLSKLGNRCLDFHKFRLLINCFILLIAYNFLILGNRRELSYH